MKLIYATLNIITKPIKNLKDDVNEHVPQEFHQYPPLTP